MDFILSALMGFIVARAAFARGGFSENMAVIKQYRLLHFAANLSVIVLIAGVAYTIYMYVPFGDTNPFLWVISKIFDVGDGRGGGNVLLAGIGWKWYTLAFLPVLLIALPRLAKYEEELFRKGTLDWQDGIFRSTVFGLLHLIMFIPLGAAFALIISGLWYTHHYFKGGVERSTVYHATYNTILVGAIFIAVLLT